MRGSLVLFKTVLFSALFSLLVITTTSFADTFTVTNLNNSGVGSLRQAIIEANANPNPPGDVDDIVFNVPPNSVIPTDAGVDFIFTVEMVITDGVDISGPGADTLTIDAQMNDRIFNIDDGDGGTDIVVSISGLSLINGSVDTSGDPLTDGGGAIFNNEILSIDSCVFENNTNTANGGAIYNAANATITEINNTDFNGNFSSSLLDGGAIYNNQNALIESIMNSTFDTNIARQGGAIGNVGNILSIESSIFTSNDTSFNSGAIINFSAGTIDEIVNSTFNNNSALAQGGAIGNSGLIKMISSTTFSDNESGPNGIFGGGAIFNFGTLENILNSTFSGNSTLGSLRGGAIYNDALIQNISGNTFSGNSAFAGGAIENTDGSTIENISSTTFSGNNANSSSGGAISNLDSTIQLITNSTFSFNQSITGGAIANSGTINEIATSVFNNNTALNDGGAIHIGSGRTILEINDSTFTDNTASSFGGAINNFGGLINKISNGRFTGNTSQNGGSISNVVNGLITEIISTTFSGGMARIQGGAIWNVATINEITYSTFNDNNSSLGGAIYNDLGAIIQRLLNSTISGNISGDGAGINNNGTINISSTTIANNEALDDGGGIFTNDGGTTNIRNSIVAFNTAVALGNNCEIIATGAINDLGGNYSNTVSCGFGAVAGIILGPLADNGGPTQTLALLGGPPLNGAPLCDPLDITGVPTGTPLPNDQRFFPRPFGPACDSGAFESGPSASVTITKVTDPPGGSGFVFNTIGFENLADCALQGNAGQLTLNDGDMLSCAVPFGNYSITEAIPANQVLNIVCSDLPPGATTNNDLGELSFSVLSSEHNVNCAFINVLPGTLIAVTNEDPGANCTQGGVKIETGPDDNLNGVLDEEEVTMTFFVCDGIPGVQGPPGPQGPQGPTGPQGPGGEDGDDGEDGFNSLIETMIEPPGDNCEFGGLKIETGLDLNRNGVLDPNEVTATDFVCNGADGQPGVDGSDCSLAGRGATTTDVFAGLLPYALIFAMIAVRRRLRKT